ncbi:MAG: hypothetical protein PHD43_19995 [Methylococcales bacterium]|nr:hypothetical protein [Methylococcales bacterium]
MYRGLVDEVFNELADADGIEDFIDAAISEALFESAEAEKTPINLKEPEATTDDLDTRQDIPTVLLDRCAKPFFNCILPFYEPSVKWQSVKQQNISSCPLPAILAAFGRVWPKKLRDMIFHDEYQPYRSTFKGRPGSGPSVFRIKFEGAGRTITISPRLHFPRPASVPPGVKAELENLVFARALDGGWVSYIEKAYVKMRTRNNRYEELDLFSGSDPPTLARVFFDFVGTFTWVRFNNNEIWPKVWPDAQLGVDEFPLPSFKDENFNTHPKNIQKLTLDRLRNLLKRAQTRPTVAGTKNKPKTLIHDHTYVVTKVSGGEVHLREFLTGGSEIIPLTLKDLRDEFSEILQK